MANLPPRPGLEALTGLLRPYVGDEPTGQLGAALDRVLDQLPAGHRLRPVILAEAGAVLAERGHVADLPADLAGLAGVVSAALARVGHDDPFREQTVRRLTGLLVSSAAYTADPGSVAQIVEVADDLVTRGAADPITAGRDHFLRAMALGLRGRLEDRPDDLRAAVDDLRAALAALPPSDDLVPTITGMLGALLHDRHLRGGDLADARAGEQFLAAAEESLRRADADHTVTGLAGLLTRTVLAVRCRDRDALSEVIEGWKAGLAGLSDGHPWRSRFDAALGLAHLTRAVVAGDSGDLDTGLRLLRRAGDELAVEVSGRPALRAAGAIADLLDGLTAGDRERIAIASRHLDIVAAETGPGPARQAITVLRAHAALARHTYLNSEPDRQVAVALLEETAADLRDSPPGDPLVSHVHTQLAVARHTIGRTADAIGSGLAALRSEGDTVLLQTGAADGLETARHAGAFAREVAEWCLAAGRPARAVEALELGRALVLHSATVTTSVEELLRVAGHPGLAEEWAAEPASAIAPADAIGRPALALLEPPSDLRVRVLTALRDAGDSAVSSVPSLGEIADGVVRCDAELLVYLLPGGGSRPGRLLAVPADGGDPYCLAAPDLVSDAPELLAIQKAHQTRSADVRLGRELSVPLTERTPAWHEDLAKLCDWAWPALIGPLLGHLGDRSPDRPHRVILIPSGGLGYVPWQAAHTRLPRPRYAVESFAFSYASSARQLIAASRRDRSGTGTVTLVADPTGSLPFVGDEVTLIRTLYSGVGVLGRAEGARGAGTPDEVLDALATSPDVLHLACHAVSSAAPDRSHLVLDRGEPLPVSRVLTDARRRGGTSGGLIVLSACSTDVTATDFDEAVTLATAFLAAGAVGVIGSRWPVDDRTTACLMVMFHYFRTTGGRSDRDALRAAQRWFLDPDREDPAPPALAVSLASLLAENGTAAADPAMWAAFTHQGA